MSTDPFDELLDLEDNFYKEGFDTGAADSVQAGLVEGKLFGIEKGYEKAIEIGRARGRALVWLQRMSIDGTSTENHERKSRIVNNVAKGQGLDRAMVANLPPLAGNARLKKHLDLLLSLTDPDTIPKDNSDVSVSEMDERITKIRARVKMISALIGESVSSAPTSISTNGIEDSTGLNARR
jgi:hypothetical protein